MLVANLQQQLVVDGYITSRVVFVDDSERDGTLMLKLMPGRIEDIRHHQDSVGNAHLSSLFPGKRGDLVNLRHLEQGLENLQRLPSVNATLDVELNRDDLSSQIIVNRQQSRLWRINAYLDDAGHDAVGRYRTGLILSFDNPLSRYNPCLSVIYSTSLLTVTLIANPIKGTTATGFIILSRMATGYLA